jgi:hypothetical protein
LSFISARLNLLLKSRRRALPRKILSRKLTLEMPTGAPALAEGAPKITRY